MKLLFGYNDFGYVKSYKKQFIKSSFFCFLFPLKFEDSYLGNKEDSIIIKRNYTSIIKTFFFIPNIFTVFLLLAIIAGVVQNPIEELSFYFYIAVLLFLFLLIYPNFIFGRTTKKEKLIREIFYQETGYSLMPNWISETSSFTPQISEVATKRFLTAFKTEDYSKMSIEKNNPNFNQYFVYVSLKAFIDKEEQAKEIYLKLVEELNQTLLQK